jgi:secretion/DNA translocation related CpaE-like protein
VLVAADALDPAGRGPRLPRRAGVVLLGSDESDAGLWRRAVDIGAERVVVLPEGDPWLVDRLTDASAGGSPPAGVVGVVGGRGGAGASVLAVALAATAASAGLRPALADLDPLGGGVDLLLGAEERPGLRWPDLAGTRGRLAPAQLRDALPEQAGIRLLSFVRGADEPPVGDEAVGPVIDALRRGHDLVVADLARSVAEPAVAQALPLCSTVLVVVPAEVRAVAAAGALTGRLRTRVADVGLVVRGPAPGGLTATEIAVALDLPLLATIPTESGLAEALERGEPPGREGAPLARACRRLLASLPVAAVAA